MPLAPTPENERKNRLITEHQAQYANILPAELAQVLTQLLEAEVQFTPVAQDSAELSEAQTLRVQNIKEMTPIIEVLRSDLLPLMTNPEAPAFKAAYDALLILADFWPINACPISLYDRDELLQGEREAILEVERDPLSNALQPRICISTGHQFHGPSIIQWISRGNRWNPANRQEFSDADYERMQELADRLHIVLPPRPAVAPAALAEGQYDYVGLERRLSSPRVFIFCISFAVGVLFGFGYGARAGSAWAGLGVGAGLFLAVAGISLILRACCENIDLAPPVEGEDELELDLEVGPRVEAYNYAEIMHRSRQLLERRLEPQAALSPPPGIAQPAAFHVPLSEPMIEEEAQAHSELEAPRSPSR